MDSVVATAMGGATAMGIEGTTATAMDGMMAAGWQQWQRGWTAQTAAMAMERATVTQQRLNSVMATARDGATATQQQQKTQQRCNNDGNNGNNGNNGNKGDGDGWHNSDGQCDGNTTAMAAMDGVSAHNW